MAMVGIVPIGYSRCCTCFFVKSKLIELAELRIESGYCLAPGTTRNRLGAALLISISPIHSSTTRNGVNYVCFPDSHVSTRLRINLRVTRPLAKLPTEAVHLDLELGNLTALCIQPLRYPFDLFLYTPYCTVSVHTSVHAHEHDSHAKLTASSASYSIFVVHASR
jgi:hypothetical protein